MKTGSATVHWYLEGYGKSKIRVSILSIVNVRRQLQLGGCVTVCSLVAANKLSIFAEKIFAEKLISNSNVMAVVGCYAVLVGS